MAIVNTNVPITAQGANEMIMQLVRTFPQLRTEVLTTSAFGRQIRTLTMGTGDRQVLFTAAHHANEWITALILLKFAEDLAQAAAVNGRIYGIEARTILKAATIHLIPLVDPDGVDLVVGAIQPGTLEYEAARDLANNYPDIPFPSGWKANLLGVDLNLQYPALWLRAREIKFSQGFTRPGPRDYVGRAPLDQEETDELAELTEKLDPDLILAYHSQGKEIYWQFQDYVVPGAKELGEVMARVSGYTLAEPEYASGFAGYKDWFIQKFRRPGYTVEVGSGTNPLPLSQFPEIYRDNVPLLNIAALGLQKPIDNVNKTI